MNSISPMYLLGKKYTMTAQPKETGNENPLNTWPNLTTMMIDRCKSHQIIYWEKKIRKTSLSGRQKLHAI